MTGADGVDAIGAGSEVPCAALRLTGAPWQRIVAVNGVRRDSVAREDAALAAEVTRRLVAASSNADVVVMAPTAGHATPFGDVPRAQVVNYHPRSDDVLAQLQPGDLLVVPAHVVAEAGVLARSRLRRGLAGVSVVVVGGPGRLRMSLGRPRPTRVGAVNNTRSA